MGSGGWCVEERMPPEILVGLDRAAFISVWHDQDMSTFWEDVSSTLHSPLLNNAAMFFFLLSFFTFSCISCFQSCLFINYSLFPLKCSETLNLPNQTLFIPLVCRSEGQSKIKEKSCSQACPALLDFKGSCIRV